MYRQIITGTINEIKSESFEYVPEMEQKGLYHRHQLRIGIRHGEREHLEQLKLDFPLK